MWGAIIPLIGALLDKLIPDKAQQDAAKLEVLKLAQSGELEAMRAEYAQAQAQIEVNKIEAATDNFRGGWRPAVGWVCVAGLAYQFLAMPVLPWLVTVAGGQVPPLPAIDNQTLLVLLTGMLGIGGLRTVEKAKGVA